MHIRICMQVTKGALACICTQVSEGVLVAYEGLCMYLPSDMVSEHVRARIELMSSKEDDPDMILMAVNLLARCCSRLDGPLLHSWVLPTFRRLAECSGFQLQEVGGGGQVSSSRPPPPTSTLHHSQPSQPNLGLRLPLPTWH